MKSARIIMIFLLLAAVRVPAAAGAKELTLRSSARVKGSEVFLSDIVEEGIGGDEDIFVAVSPGWLSSRKLRADFVRNIIRKKDYTLAGAEAVVISRDVANRSVEIRARLEEGISGKLAASRWKERCKSLDFDLIDFPEEIIIPAGDFEMECRLPGQLHGPRNVSFTVKGQNRFRRRYSVKVEFMMTVDCPVAIRSIRSGQRINPDDITWVEKNLAECYREPASRQTGLVALQASRLIPEGEVIPLDALERIPQIREGDDVEIVLTRGSLTVKVNGRSLEDGYRGERIMIRNGANGKIEKYCVIGRGKVSPGRMEVGNR
jgi:flagella basal body P-ring formation protein FlgA